MASRKKTTPTVSLRAPKPKTGQAAPLKPQAAVMDTQGSGFGGSYSGWQSTMFSNARRAIFGQAPGDLRQDLTPWNRMAMIRKCRWAERNSGLFKQILNDMVLYSVGDGIKAQSHASTPEMQEVYEAYFAERAKRIDITNRFSFYQAQAILLRGMIRDGDSFAAKVRNAQGELIQLSSLVTRSEGAAPNSISHYGRLRSASITASPGAVPIGTVVKLVEPLLGTELPTGFLYAWEGDAKNLADASSEIWWVLGLAMVIVYMTLAAQFESLVHPFTVILAVPLAAVGAFGALWLLDSGGRMGLYPPIPAMNVNLFSQIGLVLLIGLVTKNSILLVEYANQRTAAGADSHSAMEEAGRVRLRPILMTAFSTIAGILPIAIGFGAGAESRRPMGVAVVGGMLSSTFLTLYVIPVVYTLLDDVARKFRGKKSSPPVAPVLGNEPLPVK